MLVYPKDGATVDSSSTFLVGSCPPGSELTIAGEPVKLNAQGYFACVVKLKPGRNSFELVRNGDQLLKRQIDVIRPEPAKPLAPGKPAFAPGSSEPAADRGLNTGDLLALAVRATPASHVEVYLGNRKVALGQGARKKGAPVSLNLGLDTAYGKAFQRQSARLADFYYGFYRVRSDDHWQGVRPRFVVVTGKRSLQWLSPVKLTVVEQPKVVLTAHDDTIVRLGPGQARTTPLPAGVRLLVDGWQGEFMRCLVSPAHHVWIAGSDLSAEEEPGPAPTSSVRTVNVENESTGTKLAVPLTQRLPFQIEQQLKPNRLVLRIFGATADTDWIMQTPPVMPDSALEQVTWKQAGDHIYELTAHLNSSRQWGFYADYEGTTLNLHIKSAPRLEADKPLSGVTICVDPGHGGSETGSIGPSGVKESTVNLAIASRLRDLLVAEGANVVMTRTDDSQFVSLSDRVKTAIANRADLLISVHNNALPDGRDPNSEHGTSSYWYHQQSTELARLLKSKLVVKAGLPDFGTNYQNLALCRPSNMPAALVEVGFMINPDEYAQLIDPQFQQKAASALADGITTYMRGQ
jgi:N-acetylmuramoyl-L-alanine amidase